MEKIYRVIFRKNNGYGKRTRVVLKASSLTELAETIADKAKEDRLRPMRIQEMNGSTITNKYQIKFVEGEYDIIKAKKRKVSELTDVVEVDTEKVEKAEKTTKPLTTKEITVADTVEDSIEFEVD